MRNDSHEPENIRIGGIVKTLRDRRGLSLSALSRATGCARTTLRQIEAGNATAQWPTMRKLADALEVPLAVFIDEDAAREQIERLEHAVRPLETSAA
jgi:transcriptional regulator with XRE-family HTH domain